MVERWRAELDRLFDDPDRQDVLEWLVANHDRRRVVLVGSGFSRNAKNLRVVPVPLWEDISAALASDLRVDPGTFDPLSLADFHRRNLGPSTFQARLLGLLDDAAVEPGAAHAALWRSSPEAVITTNFLDTLLERDPRAQAVTEDPDLALSTGTEKAQVIYLHGHRSNFSSWVVGRSDYDDLPRRRPMLFARTRQLFAQFPLLVVGYSLTDPDFHLVYRQMVRAMDRRHPMGLAVMLPRTGHDSEQAQRAAKRYWEDLNLRIVQFRDARDELTSDRESSWAKKFISFFDLTKRIEHRKELEKSYRIAATQDEIEAAFRANVEITQSALGDAGLGHIWMRSGEERSRFWIGALNSALPETSRESGRRRAQVFNLDKSPQSTSDGSKAPSHEKQEEPSELRPSDWDPSGSARNDRRFEPVWKVLQHQQGREFLWRVNELLRHGVDLPTLVDWFRVAVERPEILDEPAVDRATVMCGLLLATSWDERYVKIVRNRASSRLSGLSELLGAPDSSSEVDPPLVVLLKQARRTMEMGNFQLALRDYAQAGADAAVCLEPDAPLLTYFARRGHADAAATLPLATENLDQYREAMETSRVAREHPFVRQWWDRVERFKAALVKSRMERLEQELARGSYEVSAASFSDGSWQLDVIREDAVQRGAPLSVERELTKGLLGAYDSEYEELAERLRLCLHGTGQWLSRQMTSGDMFRRRSRTLFADKLQAGAQERRDGVQEVGKQLFPEGSQQTVLRRRAVVDVLKSTPRIVLQDDLPLAMAEIARVRKDDPNILLGEVLASLSHVCSWDAVKDQILSELNEVLIRDFRRSADKFPWEHWITCDDFLARDGISFLEGLLTGLDEGLPERYSVGWALALALLAAPGDARLIELCGRFATAALEHKWQDYAAREQVANFAACSQAFVNKNPEIANRLNELLDQGDRAVTRILAGSSPDSNWGERARLALPNAAKQSQRGQLEDLVLAAVLDKDRIADWRSIRAILATSWNGLPLLAPILTQDRWAPGDWKELQKLLRVGGHRGKSGSWQLGRLNLLMDALEHESSRRSLFDDSPDGLGFLRHSLVDAVGSSDGILANGAVYGLPPLAVHIRSDSEAAWIEAALLAAADDVRINVAHGAAFVAHYLIEQSKGREIHGQVVGAAERVAQDLQDDPLAVVRRQAVFGASKGRQAVERMQLEMRPTA